MVRRTKRTVVLSALVTWLSMVSVEYLIGSFIMYWTAVHFAILVLLIFVIGGFVLGLTYPGDLRSGKVKWIILGLPAALYASLYLTGAFSEISLALRYWHRYESRSLFLAGAAERLLLVFVVASVYMIAAKIAGWSWHRLRPALFRKWGL